MPAFATTSVPVTTSAAVLPMDDGVENIRAIGQVLYTRYIFIFQGAGAVLLVAMIGAIVLTLRHKSNVKRQDPVKQVGRRPSETLEVVKVKSGQGL